MPVESISHTLTDPTIEFSLKVRDADSLDSCLDLCLNSMHFFFFFKLTLFHACTGDAFSRAKWQFTSDSQEESL